MGTMTDEQRNILPELPTGEELEAKRAGMDFMIADEWQDFEIERYLLDFSSPYVPPKYTLSWEGVPFAPLGGIHNITGQAGNGKTMTIAQFMAAILCGECGGLKYELSEHVPHPTVLYIDTEMEEDNTIAVKNRVLTMAKRDIGKTYDDFHVMMLRDVAEIPIRDKNGNQVTDKHGRPIFLNPAIARWRATLKAMWMYKPTVCFIDGLLDVVADFNDNIECQDLIFKCMKVASHYNTSLWCVLHQNPGGEKLVGHLGSFLERKVTDVIQTKKSKDETTGEVAFEVKQKKARSRDFNDWKFRVLPINSWGEPEQIRAIQKDKYTIEQVKEWLTQYQGEVTWPASGKDIREKIFKAKASVKRTDDLAALVVMARNRKFLIEQPEDEWERGQKYAKYYLNRDEIEDNPF